MGDALARTSGTRSAATTLGVGPSLAAEVAHNTTLWANPAAPAATVYSGVLYEAARMAHWDARLMAMATDRVRIISALWGAISPADRIPAYRLSMATTLPRLGGLAPFWRAHLGPALDRLAGGGVVVDCRSSAYASVWQPREGDWVTVRVLREKDGKRAVVSHMAKHTRGLLAARLVSLGETPATASDVADAARALVGTHLVDLSLVASSKGPSELTLVIAGERHPPAQT